MRQHPRLFDALLVGLIAELAGLRVSFAALGVLALLPAALAGEAMAGDAVCLTGGTEILGGLAA